MPRIFIDAGHGGKDFGAMGMICMKKMLFLILLCELKKVYQLIKMPEVLLSREKNEFLTLDERTKKRILGR